MREESAFPWIEGAGEEEGMEGPGRLRRKTATPVPMGVESATADVHIGAGFATAPNF